MCHVILLAVSMVTVWHLASGEWKTDSSGVYVTVTRNSDKALEVIQMTPTAGADLLVQFISRGSPSVGFKVFFSVHKNSQVLPSLSDSLWNCSVPNIADFKPHFPCDLYPQCVEKEDERDCPYFSEECGLGFVTLNGRCFFYVNDLTISWMDADYECSKRGGMLATFKKREDYDRLVGYLQPLIDSWTLRLIPIGLHASSPSIPIMYKNVFQYADGTIAFYIWSLVSDTVEVQCGYVALPSVNTSLINYVSLAYCSQQWRRTGVLCEIPKTTTNKTLQLGTIQLPSVSSVSSLPLLSCPFQHVTRHFLACDPESSCWSRDFNTCLAPLKPLPPSVACTNGFESVPYTLVCDVRPDCSDGSDESFCEYPPCDLPDPFRCSEYQCVSQSAVCDGQSNCYNQVDEDLCSTQKKGFITTPPPPAIVRFTRQGQFTFHPIHGQAKPVCPETHFQCPDNGYCTPIFLRCNGVYDCLGWEDETDCYTCPGFYRCRGSQVCVHPEHICDDILQCPQNDDELLCDLTCPEDCTCYGLAFYCRQSFDAEHYRKIRFLDGRSSGMSVGDLTENVMLIHLSLAANGLTFVGELHCLNLRSLDLSDNQIKEVYLHDLNHLLHLETLSLSGNPLSSLFESVHTLSRPQDLSYSTTETGLTGRSAEDVNVGLYIATELERAKHIFPSEKLSERANNVTSSDVYEGNDTFMPSLCTLDLSRVNVKVLDPNFLSQLPNLHIINMSGAGVDTLLGEGFQAVAQLRVLDLRGCPLTYFPRNIFKGLLRVRTIYADNYRLCCQATLPVHFLLQNCHAPSDEISSCEALLRDNSYRVFLSVFACLSLLGNSSSFIYRVFMQTKKRLLGFDVFVAHLCVADFFMGVYLGMIGVADRQYQANYLWEDHTWKKSTACQIAGFLSLVSSEVSALVICLITLDRILVLRFPFSTFHFGTRTAQLASFCVWFVGCLMAAVPLAPAVAHWQFYSQTGICIPLPVSKPDSMSYTYAFGVMIVANFVFFMVIAAGQVFIYWSVYNNLLFHTDMNKNAKKSQDLTIARRLITVAISDFLCWFPIGLLGIMAATGTPISGEVNVAMAIFVLPFNSALNPFLYTLNVVLEKRRKAGEELIKKRLVAQYCSWG